MEDDGESFNRQEPWSELPYDLLDTLMDLSGGECLGPSGILQRLRCGVPYNMSVPPSHRLTRRLMWTLGHRPHPQAFPLMTHLGLSLSSTTFSTKHHGSSQGPPRSLPDLLALFPSLQALHIKVVASASVHKQLRAGTLLADALLSFPLPSLHTTLTSLTLSGPINIASTNGGKFQPGNPLTFIPQEFYSIMQVLIACPALTHLDVSALLYATDNASLHLLDVNGTALFESVAREPFFLCGEAPLPLQSLAFASRTAPLRTNVRLLEVLMRAGRLASLKSLQIDTVDGLAASTSASLPALVSLDLPPQCLETIEALSLNLGPLCEFDERSRTNLLTRARRLKHLSINDASAHTMTALLTAANHHDGSGNGGNPFAAHLAASTGTPSFALPPTLTSYEFWSSLPQSAASLPAALASFARMRSLHLTLTHPVEFLDPLLIPWSASLRELHLHTPSLPASTLSVVLQHLSKLSSFECTAQRALLSTPFFTALPGAAFRKSLEHLALTFDMTFDPAHPCPPHLKPLAVETAMRSLTALTSLRLIGDGQPWRQTLLPSILAGVRAGRPDLINLDLGRRYAEYSFNLHLENGWFMCWTVTLPPSQCFCAT